MSVRKTLVATAALATLAACGEPPKENPAMQSLSTTPIQNTVPAITTPQTSDKLSNDNPLKPEDLRDLAAKSVVSIAFKTPGNKSSGSGFFIDKGLVVTNSHVIDGAELKDCTIAVSPPGAVQQLFGPAKIVAEDKEHDLAILEVHNKNLSGIDDKLADVQPLHLAANTYEARAGQPVFVLGSPEGMEGSFSDGKISAFRTLDEINNGKMMTAPAVGAADMIQVTAPISHGSSGSALLNDAGNVIGVCVAGRAEGQNLNLAVSLRHLRALLNSAGKTL